MPIREIDAISDAVIETEREIAGEAWGEEDTERADASGDRALEAIGDGLEGQHEEDEEADGEDAEGEADSEAGNEGEGEGETGDGKGKEGETQQPDPKAGERQQQPDGRVPAGKLREANERARVLQAELDTFKTTAEKQSGEFKSLSDKLDNALKRIDDLSRPRTEPKAADTPTPENVPDLFEDPKGFVNHLQKGFQAELSKRDQQISEQRVQTSMAIAHAFHKDTFTNAFEAINKLDPRNPDDRATVTRIYNSPNPGEELVSWHKRNETLARVGNDPTAYEERIRKEARETLMNDPEFKKQLLADMRGEATRGDNGTPRTEHRLPPSLHRAAGSNLGAGRVEQGALDDSDQAVAASAWRS